MADTSVENRKKMKNAVAAFITKRRNESYYAKFKRGLSRIFIDVKDGLVKFCEESTMHGLRYIVQKNTHIVERISWFIITALLTFFSIQLGLSQINRYLTNPTVVSIENDFRKWTSNFPAITVCLENKVDEKKAQEYIFRKFNITENHPKYEYYRSFVETIATLIFRETMRDIWNFDKDPNLKDIDLQELLVEVYSEVNVVSNMHNNKYGVIWEPIATEMGLCHTFNSAFSVFQSLRVHRNRTLDPHWIVSAKSGDDILKCSYMNKNCFVNFTLVGAIGKFFVHSPFELVEITSNPVDDIESEQDLSIEYRTSYMQAAKAVRSLNSIQKGCRYPDEAISNTIPAYSSALCQLECRIRLSLEFCGCRPFFYLVGDGKPCNLVDMACIALNMEVLISIPDSLIKCMCIPQCTEINFMPNLRKITNKQNSNRSSSIKFSLQVPKVLMHKTVFFTLTDLIASFGGTGALFLGISFLSVVEFLLFVGLKIVNIFKNKY